jgi:hypothetical protein
VEYDTQRRIPKRSASFYQHVATANELPALEAVLETRTAEETTTT